MKEYKIRLSAETAAFYEKVSKQAGRSIEQVLSDALFKEALIKAGKSQANKRR